MNSKLMVLLILSVAACSSLMAQISGFASASYGGHSNPLYNYEALSDRMLQGYLEIQHQVEGERSALRTTYVGSLVLFHSLAERNYYEHTIRVSYGKAVGGVKETTGETVEGDSEEEMDEEEADSSASYLDAGGMIGARHDKPAFKDFDNVGLDLFGSYRFWMGEDVVARLYNRAGYRRYLHLNDLSNITNHAVVMVGTAPGRRFGYGISATGGVKYFTKRLYDTTAFASVTSTPTKGSGKGKGGGAQGKTTTSKKILANATATTSFQITAGVYAAATWEGGHSQVDVLYRVNLGSPSRYLAQYSQTSMLNEDLYNDTFSYEGPEVRLTGRRTLPLGIQARLTAAFQRKRFSIPSLTLEGEQKSDPRTDLHGSVELYLSRYVTLSESLGLDLSVSMGMARNQSNDDYNDYSLVEVAFGMGIGW